MDIAAQCSEALAYPDYKGRITNILRNLNASASYYNNLYVPHENTYSRYLIGTAEHIEVYIIAWGPHADSQFHSHPEGGCWMRSLYGTLYEQTPTTYKVKEIKYHIIGYQKGAEGIHKITTNELAYSIHVYSSLEQNNINNKYEDKEDT
jgi:hypothetical protein